MRVVFCWAEVSGYSAACWRALQERPGIDLHVIHTEQVAPTPNAFDARKLLAGISNEMFDIHRPDVDRFVRDAVTARRPDVLVLCGWIYWPYTRLVSAPGLAGARKLLGMDSPWRGTLAQRLGKLRLRRVIRGLDLVITAGERSTQYARRLGVDEQRLRTGYYGFDYDRFAEAARTRPSPWPRRFLFAGRYAAEKDLPTLVGAYAQYRKAVSDPWTLTCTGQGPQQPLLSNQPGISDVGFTGPDDLPGLFAQHGALVLPSRFEPWGVVIGEAAAAGLPVVCSSACGATLDLVRPYFNGLVVPPGDVAGLSRALLWLHQHEAELREMGERGQTLAAAFSAQAWAVRWHNYMIEALACAALPAS